MTTVRQLHSQPLAPHNLGRNQSHGSYNSVPASPRLRNVADTAPRHRPQQSQQLPQNYALPLQKTSSLPLRGSPKQGHAKSENSEHMLRRKTPNGILPAAYDGTSVEHIEKPHAMKHILLPVSDTPTLPYGPTQELPLRTPSMLQQGSQTQMNQMRQPQQQRQQHTQLLAGDAWDPTSLCYDPANASRKQGQQFHQIDSMLNQVPTPQQLQYLQMVQSFGGAMQPPMQSPLGPTVSNETGLYGPYWPDGTYVPYRPAAMRDPRYHSASLSPWFPQESGYANKIGSTWSSSGNPSLGVNHHNAAQIMSGLNAGVAGYNAGATSYGAPAFHVPNDQAWPSAPQLSVQLPPASQNLFLSGFPNRLGSSNYQRPSLPHHSSSYSPHTSNSAKPTPIASPLTEFGPEGQSREKVLDWAHQIYIELLNYLHQSRRHNQHGRHGHFQSHPSIFPKPPRHSGGDFAKSKHSSQHSVSSDPRRPSTNHELPRSESTPRPHQIDAFPATPGHDSRHLHRSSWQKQVMNSVPRSGAKASDLYSLIPKLSSSSISSIYPQLGRDLPSLSFQALDRITHFCQESNWTWIDGILVGGCLAYALGDHQKALVWYSKILDVDPYHVEALSNVAATLHSLGRKQEAEQHWWRAIRLRPTYFEAVEHLVQLLCADHRNKEAIRIIEYVENHLQISKQSRHSTETGLTEQTQAQGDYGFSDQDTNLDRKDAGEFPGCDSPGYGSSGYAIPGSENGRMLSLVHAKGNLLYSLGDNAGAAKAFENAVLISAGIRGHGVNRLIKHILRVVDEDEYGTAHPGAHISNSNEPILLPPAAALKTAQLAFPSNGDLPGLRYIPHKGMSRKAAISTTSNSLLSLAKIFQDGMASGQPKAPYQSAYGVREILALYYLSLSLQPSPSTANNVGILLASVQQTIPPKRIFQDPQQTRIPGVVPGSGIALALAYYNYGLNLDATHAHLYTNLGSLLKDLGQLKMAITMYEQAVHCDGNFDIALANLANAVKDDGRIADAIVYYKRAVKVNPEFAEAVCGLANALNSVCGWSGRGGIAEEGGRRDRWHVDEHGMLLDATMPGAVSSGWLKRVVDLVEKQLAEGEDWGRGTMTSHFLESALRVLVHTGSPSQEDIHERMENMKSVLKSWANHKWEGHRVVRLIERATRRVGWQWYQDRWVQGKDRSLSHYRRPRLPSSLIVPTAPTVLPFHTFTCPMSAKQIRLISQRNGLRISVSTLKAPWIPSTVYEPPPPPNPYLKVGYVSSDFNNHPLAHLMQSVFGMHNRARVKAYCYATTMSDNSPHRQQIERESPVFYDAHSWSTEKLVQRIVKDGIHILVNLNGYTRGARNEVFAARPAPVQMSFMGFAGTLGAEWCDYLLADETAVPPSTLRPWRRNVDLEDQLVDENSGGEQDDWVYGENIIYARDTFFCCDHRQSAPDAHGEQLDWEQEQYRRWKMRKELFPDLPDDVLIMANFNQLYKIEPTTFRTWLRILANLPKAVLWLLRFPDVGETYLKQTALAWAGPEVASRVIFTDVAPKNQHIARARVCDLFLDTPECNAHTTAADVLWSGTPLLTFPRYSYKMCSRMAASILKGALPDSEAGHQAARELIAKDEDEYERFAIRLGSNCRYEGHRIKGRLADLRRLLYESRWHSALYDTKRWVMDLEESYERAWDRWVRAEGGDIWLEGSRPRNSMKVPDWWRG
ncbi:glycosyl transferase family 41-domain-containing protein [Phyllosticta citricarpa]|uniref:protein O-GlcNAc transferase n=1 Tax=Phyllosticta citricarpa TaxID=55181 RepID=A0ABR1MG75_9PEZI